MSKLASGVPANKFAAAVSGRVPLAGEETYEVLTGDQSLQKRRSTNVMVYGDQGTGKTYIIIALLKAGKKVFVVNTDFAGSGMDTIWNYFIDHPELAHLRANVISVDLQGHKGLLQFVRDPAIVYPAIWEWGPDILFWDGGTAFQSDFEEHVADMASVTKNKNNVTEHREEGLLLEMPDWGAVKTGTLRRLNKFLRIHNPVTGAMISKVVTLLEREKLTYVDGKPIEGSGVVGPDLHGSARQIAGAGFSIILQTTRRRGLGNSPDEFKFVNRARDLMTKDRGFGLPDSMEGDFEKLWSQYIEPRIAPQSV